MEWLEQLQNYHGPPFLLALLICLGTLVSEDLACLAAGVLAAKGWIPFPLALSGAITGIYLGDLALYGLGRLSKKSRGRWRWLDRLVSEERVERGRQLFERYGTRWIFLSRFLPGSRLPSYVAAGAVGWSFPRFASALAVAVLIWTPVLVGFAFFSGQQALAILEGYQKWAYPILFLLIFVLFFLFKIIIPLFSWQGRRILAGKWQKLTHWEYWPPWAVYPFAVWPLLFRHLRGGRTLDFLSCNPAMPLSGFAMESKGDILDGFEPPHPEKIRIANYLRFSEKGQEAVDTFVKTRGYPIVLKPDIGERGSGVAVIRTEEEAKQWLRENEERPAMVQEYIGGLEVGIHWARKPDAVKGRVTSLARKLPQSLTGNGSDTIEHLLLTDKRTSAMAKHFLKQFALRLNEVPAQDEKIVLTELGTHCLGAVFEDARSWISDELEATLDGSGLSYPGFYFGRYDIRVPDEDALKRGEGLVILELNGVTGEPAHIYQPGYPLWNGIKDLQKHYQLACEIGQALREQGLPPTTWTELWRTIKEHRKAQP